MIIILKQNATPEMVSNLTKKIEALDIKINKIEGTHKTIFGLIGDTSKIDAESILANKAVESVKRVQEPYKGVNRKFHPLDTVINVDGRKIGDGNVAVIAGPCSVE